MGSRNTFNLFYKSPSEKQHHNTIIPRALGKLGWLIEHQDARSPFGHPIEPMVFAHAKACEGTHCEALRRLGTRKTNEVDRRWHLAGLVYIYIVYVYSFILVAAIWRCHNFTGFVASAKTVLENHVHVLKQFEAAVALPSTGHVQVSVPWDTCSQPQGVSTPLSLCRVGSNDKPAGDSVWQQPGVEKRALRPWFLWCSFSNEGRCSGNQNFSPGWVTTLYSKAGKGHNHQDHQVSYGWPQIDFNSKMLCHPMIRYT